MVVLRVLRCTIQADKNFDIVGLFITIIMLL